MNILQTIITSLLSILIIITPFVIFGYLGIKLRKYLAARYSVKHPEKTEKDAKKHVLFMTLGVIIITIILLTVASYALFFLLKTSLKTNTDSQLSALSPKIDMHEHFRTGGDVDYYLRAMQAAHIEKMVLLPTDWPPSNPKYKEHIAAVLEVAKKYPEKFIPFATAWNKDPEAADIIERAIKDGAKGIKFIDWLSSKKYPDDAGPVDSPNMYKVYNVARTYDVPILMHIDYQKKPEWKEQFERVAADFPDVTFILAHYCRAASGKIPDLKPCAETLDKFQNVYTDISMGGGLNRYIGYFDIDAKYFRDFITIYQDRIVWGADIILDGKSLPDGTKKDVSWIFKRMLTDFFVLELKGWRSTLHPEDTTFHKGLELPKNVLQKIYWENPKRLLKI